MTDNSNKNSPQQVWLSAAAVERRYGKARSTLDRWLRDPAMNFPRPRYFRKKRAWHVAELDAFDQQKLETT